MTIARHRVCRGLLIAAAFVLGCGDRREPPPPAPMPAPTAGDAAAAARAPQLDAAPAPAGYRCERPRAAHAPPAPIERSGGAFVFDPRRCAPAAGVEYRQLGSFSIEVKGRREDVCEFEVTSETEGGYSVVGCTTPADQDRFELPFGGPLPRSCKPIRSGNVFHDMDAIDPFLSASVAGTHYSVSIRIDKENKATGKPVSRYGRVALGYQLFDDDGFTQATDGPRATGELSFRHGLGEVGSALEQIVPLGTRAGTRIQAILGDEVAHGLRDLLPAHAADARICAVITVLETEEAPPPAAASQCPAGTVWHCHLGPTSVAMKSDERICGCRAARCRPPATFLWVSAVESTWSDGTGKAKFECVDDAERIRRTRAALGR